MIKILPAKNYDIIYFTNLYYDLDLLKNSNVILLLSGGIDSQALSLYLDSKNISHKKIFFDYGHNQSEKAFAEKIGIDEQIFVDLDYLFLEKKIHLEYFKKYNTTSPQLAVHINFIKEAVAKYSEHKIVMPGTPLFFYKDFKKDTDKIDTYVTAPSYNELSYYRFASIDNLQNIFFPSFFTDFDVAEKFNKSKVQHNYFANGYTKKWLLYQDLGLDTHQQNSAYTGFEQYKIYLYEKTGVKFDKLLRQPVDKQKKIEYIFPDELVKCVKKYL
jgi:hypothetical protein